MRVFLVGDCESDNGPGIANRKIRDALVNNFEVSYSQATGKWRRIIEVITISWRVSPAAGPSSRPLANG